MQNIFFELIQVAIGHRKSLSRVLSTAEWNALYGMAVKQAVAGVCFYGIQRLPKDQQPPKGLLLQWFALAEQIKQRNRLVNARACELQKLLEDDGLRACVLKGQGVARLYDFNGNVNLNLNDKLGAYRQSGDIDVWVDAERDDTIRHMKAHYKCGRAVIHHIDVEVFDDVPVEVHFVPSYSYSLLRYRVYKRFFNEYKNECFVPSGLGFCVPSLGFNVVYMLLHIFRHVFHEGIGLRQLMDYYFVLRNVNLNLNLNVKRNANAIKALREMGLLRFAAAVMYVEQEVFGLQKEYMLCEPDEKAGQYLLDEILRAGNFGQYDPRIREAHSGGMLKLYMKNVKRISDMVRYYPSEVLWAPLWKIGHFVWRKAKGYL